MITFRVDSLPVAQPRQQHRIVKTRGGRESVQNYTPANSNVNAFKAAVMAAAAERIRVPIDGPVHLAVGFVMPRPKSKCWKTKPMPRYHHTGKPDLDNLLKSLKDALTQANAWRDDSQVTSVTAEKWVAAGNECAHVVVEVHSLRGDLAPAEAKSTSDTKNRFGNATP